MRMYGRNVINLADYKKEHIFPNYDGWTKVSEVLPSEDGVDVLLLMMNEDVNQEGGKYCYTLATFIADAWFKKAEKSNCYKEIVITQYKPYAWWLLPTPPDVFLEVRRNNKI